MRRDRGESTVGAVALAAVALVAGSAALVGATLRQNRADDAALRAFTARLDTRLGDAVAGRRYAYTRTNADGSPARWNPCEPVHYVLNPAGAPPGAAADVTEAVRRVAAATGLTFAYDGPTTEAPSAERAPYQPDRYGRRWAPLLVAWAPLASVGIPHEPHTVGVSTPYGVGPHADDLTIVSGQIVLEAERDLAGGFETKASWGAVVMHELGHAVGLAHVADPTQIMDGGDHPGPGPAQWGDGDRAGLRGVGAAGGCRKVPRAGPA